MLWDKDITSKTKINSYNAIVESITTHVFMKFGYYGTTSKALDGFLASFIQNLKREEKTKFSSLRRKWKPKIQ